MAWADMMIAFPARMAARDVRGRILELDVLRGVSILLVLLHHAMRTPDTGSWLYPPFILVSQIGWTGVDIFFVLSGFLVGGLLMREYRDTGKLAPGRFWVRRAFKVWPTFYAHLFAYACAVLLVEPAATRAVRARVLAAYLWPNLLHVQNYFNQVELAWLWSLAVEEHFYLVLPWTLLLLTRRAARGNVGRTVGQRLAVCFGGVAVLCLALRGITAALIAHVEPDPFLFPTHLRIDALFCGVVLAYVAQFHGGRLQRLYPYRYVILAVSLFAWAPLASRHGDYFCLYPFGPTLIYLGAGGLVLFAHLASTRDDLRQPTQLGRLLRIPLVVCAWLGVRSYAIYVWHYYFGPPIAVRVVHLLHLEQPAIAINLVYVGSFILVGAIMYPLVELPGLRARQRFVPANPVEPTRSLAEVPAVAAPSHDYSR